VGTAGQVHAPDLGRQYFARILDHWQQCSMPARLELFPFRYRDERTGART